MKSLFEEKLRKLSDDKLLSLTMLRADYNQELVALARGALKTRYPGIQLSDPVHPPVRELPGDSNDLTTLNVFNWAACLLVPLWLLAHRLDRWLLLLLFIVNLPLILLPAPHNAVVTLVLSLGFILSLGLQGNKYAYANYPNPQLSTDEFMRMQKAWRETVLMIFLFRLLLFVVDTLHEFMR